MIKKLGIFAIAAALSFTLAACGGNTGDTDDTADEPLLSPELTEDAVEATITLDSGEEIKLELYPKVAPETVDNFVDLAEDGFYDGLIFHRVIEDFMIQGGGYDENLKEQKASTIDGEFSANGFDNPLSHRRGVISMARAQQFNSASSQFFIVQEDSTYLDGQYAAFGVVTEGMDVVDDIASVRTGSVTSSGMENVPVNPIVIESITIDSASVSSSGSKDKNSDKNSDKDDDKDSKSGSKDKNDTDDTDDDGSELDEETMNKILESIEGSSDSSSGGSSKSSGSLSNSL